ncbi:MAG TPA: hypothetical protein VG738_00125 [Chitinophagaceae bacterium]|nr:hypothetical protein [Chitinophagaceae bacterium]
MPLPFLIATGIERLLNINWQAPARLAEAGVAALICGFLGAWGKHLFTLVMKKLLSKKSKSIQHMKALFKNWKTTSAGIVTIAGGITLFLHDSTKFVEGLTAVLAGLGLLFAHDGDNTQAGSGSQSSSK